MWIEEVRQWVVLAQFPRDCVKAQFGHDPLTEALTSSRFSSHVFWVVMLMLLLSSGSWKRGFRTGAHVLVHGPNGGRRRHPHETTTIGTRRVAQDSLQWNSWLLLDQLLLLLASVNQRLLTGRVPRNGLGTKHPCRHRYSVFSSVDTTRCCCSWYRGDGRWLTTTRLLGAAAFCSRWLLRRRRRPLAMVSLGGSTPSAQEKSRGRRMSVQLGEKQQRRSDNSEREREIIPRPRSTLIYVTCKKSSRKNTNKKTSLK